MSGGANGLIVSRTSRARQRAGTDGDGHRRALGAAGRAIAYDEIGRFFLPSAISARMPVARMSAAICGTPPPRMSPAAAHSRDRWLIRATGTAFLSYAIALVLPGRAFWRQETADYIDGNGSSSGLVSREV